MKALDLMSRVPWAITDDALQGMLEIASRENLSPAAVEAKLGRPLDNTRTVTVRDGVATIPVMGPIFRYADLFVEICGATSIDTLARDFNAALDNGQVRAIVFQIDSPGGEVNGTSEFASMVYGARGTKPITAYVADLGCSAAYWIASACDEIVVADTATVGSIGVVAAMRKPNEKDTSVEFVSSQSPDKRPDIQTEKGRATIQRQVDSLADVFVSAVARNRGVSEDTVLTDFGQGGVLIGQEAVDAGLADRVGTYEGTLATAVHNAQGMPTRTNASLESLLSLNLDPLGAAPREEESVPTEPITAAESPAVPPMPKENIPVADDTMDTPAVTIDEPMELTALQQRVAELEAERDEARGRALLEEEQRRALEAENRKAELRAIAAPWHGDTERHIEILERLNPESAAFYVETLNALTEQVKAGALFQQAGASTRDGQLNGSAHETLEGMAAELRKTNPDLTKEQAYVRVLKQHSELYTEHVKGN